MSDFCKHWTELDDSRGPYECCKKKSQKCYCGASESNCSFPGNFEDDQDAIMLRDGKRIEAEG